jgi:DNA replication protein DnaC
MENELAADIEFATRLFGNRSVSGSLSETTKTGEYTPDKAHIDRVSEWIASVGYHNRDMEKYLLLADYMARYSHRNEFRRFRGLMLHGGNGSGKTYFMERCLAIGLVTMTTATKIVKIAKNDSEQTAMEHAQIVGIPSVVLDRQFHLIIDELGYEPILSSYGHQRQFMADVIMARYEMWKNCGVITHFTTNLKPKELSAAYGARPYSRICEMCEVIQLDLPDYRMRKELPSRG